MIRENFPSSTDGVIFSFLVIFPSNPFTERMRRVMYLLERGYWFLKQNVGYTPCQRMYNLHGAVIGRLRLQYKYIEQSKQICYGFSYRFSSFSFVVVSSYCRSVQDHIILGYRFYKYPLQFANYRILL